MEDKKTIILFSFIATVFVTFVVLVVNDYTQIKVIPLLVVCVMILCAAFFNLKDFSNKKYFTLFIFLFIIKFVLLCYQSVNKNLPMGGVDWWNYNRFALDILENENSIIDFLLYDGELFSKGVAVIYYIFGHSIELIYFYVFATSLFAQLFIYKTVYLLTNNKNTAQKISLLWMVWPIAFIFSITYLREIPIQFLFAASFYFFVLFIKQKRFYNFIICVIFVILATLAHSGMIAVLISYLLIWATSSKRLSKWLRIGFGIACFVVLLTLPVGQQMIQKFGGAEDVEDVIAFQDKLSFGNTDYIGDIPDNTSGFIMQIPYRFVMFSLSPLPWQIYDFNTLIALIVDGLLQLYIFFLLFRWTFKYKPANEFASVFKKSFIIVLLATYFVFSLGTNNYGTAMRHRAKILPMIILLIPLVSNKQSNTLYIKQNNKKYE